MTIRIETLDDILPHVPKDVGIVHIDRGAYSVIDYTFMTDKTFPTPESLECRGLKFDRGGRLIARPFHKFFNLGERQQPHEIDWSAPHVVLDKLDGSMIHPARLDGDLVFMTRMGMSPHARRAWDLADGPARTLCADLVDAGMTPLFEFTSPDNRVVVAYGAPTLTLLAVRDMVSGRYHSHAELEAVGNRYGVPLAEPFGRVDDPTGFVARARALEGVEGYVVAFDDGHRVKVKADAYVLRHKALDGVRYEKNLVAWITADAVDDVLPLLRETLADRVRDYRDRVLGAVERHRDQVAEFHAVHKDLPRRDYALAARETLDKRLQSAAFAMLDGQDGRQAVMKPLVWGARSENRLDSLRDLFDMNWDASDIDIGDG